MTCSFLEFIWIWDQIQNLKLPEHHQKMAGFLSELAQNRENGLLMAFRNSGKSTLVGLFAAWILLQNPNTRILILSADQGLAKKMVHHIRGIIEQHPLTEHLKPGTLDEWASNRFTVQRQQYLRDPSVLARSLLTNMTGCRADVIICDDIEVPKTSDTSFKRQMLQQKLSELDYILTPKGFMIYVGTPHTFDTIYQTEENGFLKNWKCLKIPLLNEAGLSNWPDRFDENYIKTLRQRTGPNKFSSQMMLEPVSPEDSRLDINRLRFYRGNLSYREANGTGILSLNGQILTGASCWWDPAFGSPNGDKSVVACMFFDDVGNAYLERLCYLIIPPNTEATDYQCRQVARLIHDCYIPAIHLETNGIGKFLPALLRRELATSKTVCAVLEETSHQNKAMRILSAFDAPLMNGSLWINENIRHTPFLQEMRDFTPGGTTHDDGLDAVAGCLLSEPVHFKRPFGTFSKHYSEWRF